MKASWRDLDWWIPRLMVLTILAVAVFAFVQSYTHVYYLGQTHHETGASLRMLPLSVDWLMFAAGLTRLHVKRKEIKHWFPPAALALGAIATLIANIAFGIVFGWETAAIAAWAPVVLFVVVELGMLLVKTAKVTAKPEANGPFTGAIVDPAMDPWVRVQTELRQPSEAAPPPGDDTATFPATTGAVTGSPQDTLAGWGQLGGQQAAAPGLSGIGLNNGRK